MQGCVVHADLFHCCYRDCICVAGWRHLATDVLARPAGSLRSWSLLRRWVATFIIWQTNNLWPEAIISLVYKSNKSVYHHGNHMCCDPCRRQQCDPTLWQQCWGTSPSLRSAMTASSSCRRNSTKTSAGQTSSYTKNKSTSGIPSVSFCKWSHSKVKAGIVVTVTCVMPRLNLFM